MTKSYAIVFTRRARKDIDRLDRKAIGRIAPVIDALADDPRPAGCLKVKTKEGLWRVRVGDWPIGYEIDVQPAKCSSLESVTAANFMIE